jgi:hypothetical protein
MQDFARRAAEEFSHDSPAPQQEYAPTQLSAHRVLWQVIKAKLAQFARWLGIAPA